MNKTEKNAQSAQSAEKISDETILKITKEIAVKFIETGRLTPASFRENFQEIYSTIKACCKRNE